MRILVIVGCAIALAACSSPPKPPTVSGADRSGINSGETSTALEFQAELAQTKERVRKLELRANAPAVVVARAPSQTVTFHFDVNSATLKPSASEEAALLPLLATASRIEIRGRTDAANPSASDERLAFSRAQAAMNYLVARGVPVTKMAINFQSSGDPVGSPDLESGRAENRRVEIEVFNQ